jgi:hypothetical protein|tara:strand:+ start:485 stop:649 length:165 start_codon:yes stop_codon:yes gene_type:complete
LNISEVFCHNCKEILGKYNTEFYSDTQIGDVIKIIHTTHIREGHDLVIREITKK